MDTDKPFNIESWHEIVVVFDLDDTLYAEADYVLSGKRAVANMVDELFGQDIAKDVMACEGDFLEYICRRLNLPQLAKTSLLWHYRLHRPEISLRDGAKEVIQFLRKKSVPICLITDGRSVTQRLKIAALDLDFDAIYISEEVGVGKPDARAFALVEAQWQRTKHMYIGDNITKDFIAPNARGWITCGLRSDSRHIHNNQGQAVLDEQLPKYWINDFEQLKRLLLTI